jgi:hypothetical protein
VHAKVVLTYVVVNLGILWLCAQDVQERARRKGRRERVWVTIVASVWLFVAAVVTASVVLWYQHFDETPDLFMLFAPAFIVSLIAAIQVGRYLDRQPSLLPQPPAVGFTFTFPCPHCRQRVSATRDMVGTTGNCPACQTSFVVPASFRSS